ncbi:MAG: response regulator [Gammaproteobacteria bacterium]
MPAKILLVDDVPANIDLLEAILSKQGYELAHAYGGEEALAMVSDFQPHIALVDVMMPDMNGYQLCMQLRRQFPDNYLPIIFITASEVTQEDVVEGFTAGGDDYICKPFDTQILLARIAACLRVKTLQDRLGSMQSELARYVSRPTMQMVTGKISGQQATDSRLADVTILFSDVRDFTHRTEHMCPQDVFRVLNESLSFQIDLIEKHGGTIDKLSGDEVMAIFEGDDMAARAITCAREIMQMRNEFLAQDAHELPRIGIGINTGPVYLGSVGKAGSFLDYTAVGAPVNIAARLCGVAKNAQVLISKSTLDSMGNTLPKLQSIGFQPIKGLSNPMEIFELIIKETVPPIAVNL